MGLDNPLEPTAEYRWLELSRAARKLIEEIFPIQPGEQVLIIADTLSDWRVVQAVSRATCALGAVPATIVYPATAAPATDPPRPVAAAMATCDAAIELEGSYLHHSPAQRAAMKAGVRLMVMGGGVDEFVRLVGDYRYPVLARLVRALNELTTHDRQKVHVTSEAGTDLWVAPRYREEFGSEIIRLSRRYGIEAKGYAQVPPGQTNWDHMADSPEGVMVFDGFAWPPDEVNVLHEPVRLTIEKGTIRKIEGGRQAMLFERWLRSWGHPAMLRIAHCTYGCNPGVWQLKGNVAYDERVFGCVLFGIGPAWEGAPSHTDGSMLSASLWADDVQILERGRFVHPELVALAHELGAKGY